MKALIKKINRILKDRRTRRLLTRIVSVNAALVVFVTTYALVLPAITMEAEAQCGIEAHQHDDSCYEDVLVCGQEESEGHTHDESCYSISQELICEIPEHQHDENCYDEDGNLQCQLQEHEHTADCYKEVRELTCTLEESEGHHHTDACYEKNLICGKEVHTHSPDCYEKEAADAVAASAGYTAGTDSSIVVEEIDHVTVENQGTEESAAASTTNVLLPEDLQSEDLSEGYVPQLDSLNFDAVLNDHTGFYYFHPEEGEEVPANTVDITSWEPVDKNTELAPTDLVKAYLSYTIPAGSLNETNQIARYRLPANIHLTDDQIIAINNNENGIAAGYVDPSTNTVLDEDADNYHKYLGAEAVEGTRRPDQDSRNAGEDGFGDTAQEYISATVKAENVFDEEGLYGEKGAYLGQDLIFVFSPYTIEKNQTTYDTAGNPTAKGEKVTGWFAVDLNMEQIDWSDPVETILPLDDESQTAAAQNHSEDQNQNQEQAQEQEQGQAQDQGQETVQEQTAADENIQPQESAAKSTRTALQRIERTANVVFVSEGKDENNHKIHEISTELKLVQENEIEIEDEDQPAEASEEQAESPGSDDVEDTSDPAEPEEDGANTDTEAVSEENKEEQAEKVAPEYKDGTLEANGSGYKITMDYKADAQIPEYAYLHVTEITRESDAEAYEACLEEARKSVPSDGTRVDDKASRFFDIEILVDEPVSKTGDDKALQENLQEGNEKDAENKNTEFESAEFEMADPEGLATADPNSEVAENSDSEIESAESETVKDKSTGIEEKTSENTEEVPSSNNEETVETGYSESDHVAETDEEQIITRKIEPAAPVSVNIQLFDTELSQKANDFNAEQYKVVHIAEDGTEEIQGVKAQTIETEKKDAEPDTTERESNSGAAPVAPATEVQFEAESFSIYGVVYTVDFHWEVDGKVYEISIPGGGFLSFEKLVEILEIAKTDEEAESGNNQRAKSESDAAEETENSDEMAENNEASESTEDIEPDKETENTDKTVSASDDSQINEISDELSKKDIFLLALKDVRVSEETKEFVAKVDHIEFSNPELLWVDKVEKECTVSELKENNNLEVQYSDELTEEQIDEINAQTVETGDWALISLQQFYTEETLTVTMTNGKTWTIRVTDAVAENPVRNPGTVNTVDTYADGVKMWLFNYDTDGNLDDSSNKIKFNGTDHTGKVGFNNNTLASDGINGYSGLKFLGWGSDSDYNITSNVDINNFTGLDESGQGKGNKIKALQGIVQNSLDENGYPVLNSQYSSTSLDYLFDPTANTNDRVVYGGENGNVTNLFRKENGYYKFDSNQHYAQFDGDHTFTVYDTTIPQTDKNGNKHNPTRAVGFFPFNSYNNMLGIWDTNQNQNGSHTLYLNPDRDTSKTDRAGVKDLDHHFGVMLEAKFVLPADGKDENGNPIRFDFSGDDDMWVFIDDELVLDIGGIHQPVSGTIDFQNGKAYVVGDHTVAGHSDNTGTNAVATAYGAGVTRNSTGDGNYYFYNDDSVGKKIQLGDGKVHTMKIFYIERGGCDSNCEITFNLPTVKTGNLDLKKVWGDVERRAEEVYYTITANYKEASDANKRDLAKFFSSMTEKQLTQYGLTKDNIKQIDANNDGVLDTNDPYVFVVKGSDWELKIKQLRICQDSLQNGNLTHDQIPLTYTVLERYALVDGKIVDATDQYSQAVEKSGAQLPSTSDIILGENDVSLWQDITGNNATFKVTNEPGMNVTVNKDWAQDCDPLSDTTITGVVKRYKLVDKGNTLTIQSVLEDTDNSGIDFSGVTYTIMKNGQQVGDPISFAEAQAGKNLELPDSGPYTVVENNVPGTPQGYSVVHNPQNQQHNVTLDPNGNTTVTFTSTYKQVNKPSNSTYLIRDYYYYNYQGGKDLNSGNIEFPVGARVTMKFKCRNGYWSSRDMKAEYNGERINITASAKDYNQNLEFTVGPFTVVENGRLVVDVNTNGNSNNDGFVSGSVNFTQVRSLHSNLRAMRMPLKAAPQKTDLTFSQELNETTLASLPAAPEGKHYVLDNWSKEVNLDAASDWTKTVAVEVGNNYGDYYYFLASVTEHNVTQDTQGTIATNNDGSIRFAHKHADSNLPFEIENKRAKGALKITKNVTYNNGTIGDIPEGKESLVDKEFKFTVTKDGTQIEGSPFSITITNGASKSLTIPDLEMGNYVITETDSKGLELTAYTGGISQDSTTKSVTVTVTARDNTAAQPTAQAFFTNNYSETDIIVKKVDQDKATANPEDAERFIAGAKFSLLDGDERAVTGYKVINLKTNQEVVLEDNKFVVPLEGVKITGLLNGRYVLKEREAPAGYIITNNTTAFTVADGQVTAGGNGLTFEIPNPPGAALPNTGGPGTNKIYLLGIMLSGIAGAGLVMRKRRRAA